MESEIVHTAATLSPIYVALIGAGAGLISGAVASLIAPWVHYAVEEKRKSKEIKILRIAKCRTLLDQSTELSEIRKSSLWGFIDKHLNSEERKKVFTNTIICVLGGDDGMSQDDYKMQNISRMLNRLESEWKLI